METWEESLCVCQHLAGLDGAVGSPAECSVGSLVASSVASSVERFVERFVESPGESHVGHCSLLDLQASLGVLWRAGSGHPVVGNDSF